MKTSKKIIIPFFSTIVGLSLAAGVGGAFAWYQYNSRVSASFMGASVADTGTLQIGWKTINNNGTPDDDSDDYEEMNWGRDHYVNNATLVPVTFGKLGANNALPAQAYAYPEAGCGEGYDNWAHADAGVHYAQFDIYVRALQTDKAAAAITADQIREGYKRVARKVFISAYKFQVGNDDYAGDSVADKALRVHVAEVGSTNNHLISKTAYTPSAPLNLYGPLDLDGNGSADTYHETPFNTLPSGKTDGDPIRYGVNEDTQVTEAIGDLVQTRETDGTMDQDSGKELFTTKTDADVQLRITVWLEGWEYLQTEGSESQIWDAKYSTTNANELKVGLQFDTGKFREADLA